MATDSDKRLERRVSDAAEAALAARGFVTAIDVLTGLGWLPPSGQPSIFATPLRRRLIER
jgi:hypothetical protein